MMRLRVDLLLWCGAFLPAASWVIDPTSSLLGPLRKTLWREPLALPASSIFNDDPTSRHVVVRDPIDLQDDATIQWQLFQKYQAPQRPLTSWKGIWTTYDYMGDVMDETVASVDYEYSADDEQESFIQHRHTMVIGATRSDCATCFDRMETTAIPVTTYSAQQMRRNRCAACGMVSGPTLLRSGVVSTELVLAHGEGRVRALLQYAPVWPKDNNNNNNNEPEGTTGPPSALKLFRTVLSREALRSTPPSPETEALLPPLQTTEQEQQQQQPLFYRPVSPFAWHKKWGGSSWTWGPQYGNRGWSIQELEELDSWQGVAPVECWNLRLPGGIMIQAPRIMTTTTTMATGDDDHLESAHVDLLRLAWLPNDGSLLRLEAGVLVQLKPVTPPADRSDSTASTNIMALAPPTLASLRCDMLTKLGDLEGEPVFLRSNQAEPSA